jgi:hypothetical protein
VADHRDQLAITRVGAGRLSTCCYATQRGTLAQAYGWAALEGLTGQWRRVLTQAGHPELVGHVDGVLADHADMPPLDLAVHHEQVPKLICALALGYPPEVTAGMALRRCEHPCAAETGAWCAHTKVLSPREPDRSQPDTQQVDPALRSPKATS